MNSTFEIVAGELHAKLMGGSRAWPDNEPTRQPHVSNPAPLEWRTLEGREGLAAVPVAVAGPGWAIHSDQAPPV